MGGCTWYSMDCSSSISSRLDWPENHVRAQQWRMHMRNMVSRCVCSTQVRTTAAVTVLQAGTAENVLPQTATVGINFRLLPGHTVNTVLQLVKGWLGRWAGLGSTQLCKRQCASTATSLHTATTKCCSCIGSMQRTTCTFECSALLQRGSLLLIDPDTAMLYCVACRDLPYATIHFEDNHAFDNPVADASGPHFAVIRAALQQHWRLDQPGSPPVPVLPVMLPGKFLVGFVMLSAAAWGKVAGASSTFAAARSHAMHVGCAADDFGLLPCSR